MAKRGRPRKTKFPVYHPGRGSNLCSRKQHDKNTQRHTTTPSSISVTRSQSDMNMMCDSETNDLQTNPYQVNHYHNVNT